jgi:hypothetical protein
VGECLVEGLALSVGDGRDDRYEWAVVLLIFVPEV